MQAPLLITAYRRPNLLKNLLNQISALECNVYLFVDGETDYDSQDKRSLIRKCRELAIDFSESKKNTKCFFPKTNLGLARGVVSAVDWAFETEQTLVILEDDLSLHREALRVASHFLVEFRDVKEVGSVSLYRPAIFDDFKETQETLLLSPLSTSWGWATWSDRWSNFRVEQFRKNSAATSAAFLRLGGLAGLVRWQGVIRALGRDQLDSWAYPWMFTHFLEQWNAVIPKFNLVENLGFGDFATHTRKGKSNEISLQPEYTFDISTPKRISKKIQRELLRDSYGIYPYMERVRNRLLTD